MNSYLNLSRSLFSGSGLGSHGSCDCGVEFLSMQASERVSIEQRAKRDARCEVQGGVVIERQRYQCEDEVRASSGIVLE